MKRTLSIIGATTKTGTAVAKELVTGAWHLLLLDDNPGLMDQLLNELKVIAPCTDAEVLHCMVDACWEADIIILAIPVSKQNDIPARLREVATGKTVISIGDSGGDITWEELNAKLPYSKVIRVESSSVQELFIHLNKI